MKRRMADARRVTVVLVQLPIPPPGCVPAEGNVPLAAGFLKLAARVRGLDRRHDVRVVPGRLAGSLGDRGLVEEILSHGPAIVGFTCYLWNVERTLWVAARLKERAPAVTVVLGGPEISGDNRWVLESGPVDVAVCGEGETAFCELLEALDARSAAPRRGGQAATCIGAAGPPMELDDLSSPYLAGILPVGDGDPFLLETTRGCLFGCRFCHYPKGLVGTRRLSAAAILENLAAARQGGAREVFLLDPTLNQRGDFAELVDLLARGNPHRRMEYHAELRAEGIRPDVARRMAEAGFREVEIGLQSIEPRAQELMGRRNGLRAFERGVRALRDAGVRAKVDLIVGLPGDTPDSVRRGMRYLSEGGLCDEIQVFPLAVLPGTSFREDAAALGLEHDDRPPYHVRRTPDLGLDDILELLAEAEDVFGTEFDPLPPPRVPGLAGDAPDPGVRVLDLDRPGRPAEAVPPPAALALWLRTRDPWARIGAIESAVRDVLANDPFTVLQVAIETTEDFPMDVFRRVEAASAPTVGLYAERSRRHTLHAHGGARRIVTVLPESARAAVGAEWVQDALRWSEILWRRDGAPGGLEPAGVEPAADPGEWIWTR